LFGDRHFRQHHDLNLKDQKVHEECQNSENVVVTHTNIHRQSESNKHSINLNTTGDKLNCKFFEDFYAFNFCKVLSFCWRNCNNLHIKVEFSKDINIYLCQILVSGRY
jgi:hypothetical protein